MGWMGFSRKKNSGDMAKDRLKLLLVSDRANCSPDVIEMVRNDMIDVISKYMEIDTERLEIQIAQAEEEDRGYRRPVLFAHIPILDMRHTPVR